MFLIKTTAWVAPLNQAQQLYMIMTKSKDEMDYIVTSSKDQLQQTLSRICRHKLDEENVAFDFNNDRTCLIVQNLMQHNAHTYSFQDHDLLAFCSITTNNSNHDMYLSLDRELRDFIDYVDTFNITDDTSFQKHIVQFQDQYSISPNDYDNSSMAKYIINILNSQNFTEFTKNYDLANQKLNEAYDIIDSPLNKWVMDPFVQELLNLLDSYLKSRKIKLEEFVYSNEHKQKFYKICTLQSIKSDITIEFLSLTMDSIFTIYNLRKHAGTYCYIKTLCVSQVADKLGYGKYILNTLQNLSFLEQSQRLGFNFSKVSLHATSPSYAFYQKQGFNQSSNGIYFYKPLKPTKIRFELDHKNNEYLMTKLINFNVTKLTPGFKEDHTPLTIVLE